ncbi:hypothetical protein MKW92_010667 [Papaver armeniacum]|nr:hypothetical protein MKW92_010667 [Papaver armeniacum]
MENHDGEITNEEEDICESVLSRFRFSSKEHHQHLCAVVETEHITALLTFLSMVLRRISKPILGKMRSEVSKPILKILKRSSAGSVEVGSVIYGLKCLEYLIVAGDNENRNEIEKLYDVVLGFISDHRSKVRKQCHTCLHDILQSLKGTGMLAPACQNIMRIFERNLSFSQAFLHIIHCLKNCLPLMAEKSITRVLNHYKSLLELDQPVVSRLITDSLNALFLVDLLGSLENAVHKGNLTADRMTFAACLLDVGMRKVYSLDRQECVVKLLMALKSLIHACIDKIVLNSDAETRKSGKPNIERICDIIESLLGYKYNDVLDLAFSGNLSSYLLTGTLRRLADIQDPLLKCIGSALGALGPETFLSILPLNLESEDVSESRVWLFPILQHYTVGANLSFFTKSILDKVKFAREKSQRLLEEGRIQSLKEHRSAVYALWSLFPAFCNYPMDTANSFKDLKEALCRALPEEPDILGKICSGLQILIQQNKRMAEGNNDLPANELSIPEKRAMALYTQEVAKANLKALKSSAGEFLSVLSSIFLTGADVEHLLAEIKRLEKTMPENSPTIHDLKKKLKEAEASKIVVESIISHFVSMADKKDIQWSFESIMKRLSEVTKESLESEKSEKFSSMEVDSVNELLPKAARARLLDLAVSHLHGLDSEAVKLLNTSYDSEGLLQRTAYKILSIILKFKELPSCHFSAKRHRLHCLYFLIVHVSKNASEQWRGDNIKSFLMEIILAVKEKTRNMPDDLLVQIGHACGEEEQGGNKENLQQLFNILLRMAQLAYEFSDLVSSACDLLPTVLLLLKRKSRKISKVSNFGLKVLVARSPAEWVQIHLRSVVKLHLKMLVKKCGLDAVKAVIPEEHIKLLKNIDKVRDKFTLILLPVFINLEAVDLINLYHRKDDAASKESKSPRSKATTSSRSIKKMFSVNETAKATRRSAKRSLPDQFEDKKIYHDEIEIEDGKLVIPSNSF